MKTSRDSRHLKRVSLMQQLFSWNSNPTGWAEDARDIVENIEVIDKKINESAPLWPISQINKIDLAILRLAVFELTIAPELKDKYTEKSVEVAPVKVVIDEAVELAKEYGSDSSPSFINGVLGKLVEINKLKT